MPKNKDLKRLVRSRMRKTGESYTSARARLLQKKRASAPLPEDYLQLAGMSDAAVSARTGRTWPGWVGVLDAADAAGMPHREIARLLHEEHALPGWWAQTVTVGYERIRGLRDVGQRRGGQYEAHKSRTLPVPVSRLYRAFHGKATRRRWLPDVDVTISAAASGKSIRMRWPDGTRVEARFTAKGRSKSQVTIQHRQIPDKAAAGRARKAWGERLDALAALLLPER